MIDPGLSGKTALVTGGASGIGRAIASALEEQGVRAAVVDRSPANVGSVRLQANLGDAATAERVVEEAIDRLGRIDLFVNCAAIALHEPIQSLSVEAVEATLASNFTACVWLSREVARHMIANRGGSILVVGSTSVYTPAIRESIYRSSKAALKAFAEVLSLELAGHGIRVNVLTPGAVATPLTAGMDNAQRRSLTREIPLGREAAPEELAASAIFLLSDKLSPYTTGTELTVDGGLRLRPLTLGRE